MPSLRLACCIAIAVATLPLTCVFAAEFDRRPYYQYSAAALIVVPLLAWRGVRRVSDPQPGPAWQLTFWTGLAIAAFAIATAYRSPCAGIAAAAIGTMAITCEVGGWPLVRAVLPAAAVLAVCVPLPFGIDRRVLAACETAVAANGGRLLDLFDVANVSIDRWLESTGGRVNARMFVAGFWSPFALIALTVASAAALGRGWLRIAADAVMAVAFGLATASAGAAYLAANTGPPRPTPEAFVAGAFLLAAVLTLSADQFFGIPAVLRPAVVRDPSADIPAPPAGPAGHRWSVGVAVTFAILGPVSLLPQTRVLEAVSTTLPSLPDTVGVWRGISHGATSRGYRDGYRTLAVDVVSAQSDPVATFANDEWVVRGRQTFVAKDALTAENQFARVDFERFADGCSTVWLSGPTASGLWTAPPGRAGVFERMARRLGGSKTGHGDPTWWLIIRFDGVLPPSLDDVKAVEQFQTELWKVLEGSGRRKEGRS